MRILKCLFLMLTLICSAGCSRNGSGERNGSEVSKTLDGPLGTVSTVTLYDWDGGEAPVDSVFAMLKDTDAGMTALGEESQTAAISDSAGTPVRVTDDMFGLIEYAVLLGAATGGAFDITIRPVVELWGIGTEGARIPEAREIDEALSLVGYEGITLDRAGCTVMLNNTGMRLDLGAIAKGFACDRAVEMLRVAGVGHALIDLGGNIYVLGAKPDGSPWRVGVKKPIIGESGYFGIVETFDRAVVTSGVYERFYESGGRYYHHIMDPRTGYPADSGLISVTIICESAQQADALSTACFVLGAESGMEYLSALSGVEGIFVSEDCNVRVTDGLLDSFKITDPRFRLADMS